MLPQIEQAMDDVFNCFDTSAAFTLTPAQERLIFWRDEIAMLRYDPIPAMLMLHTILVARVNPFATGSNVSESYTKQDPATLNPVYAHRVRQYYTPYMLDGWFPHFTLLMPYKGAARPAMQATLLDLFPAEPINVESISLLVQDDDEAHYHFHHEYFLKDYPQLL